MKNAKKLSYILFLLVLSHSLYGKEIDYNVDLKASKLEWEGRKVTGEHNGLIGIKKATLRLLSNRAGTKITSLVGSIVIDMSSIVCSDIGNKTYNRKLVKHLQSKDFFYTEKFPTAKIKLLKLSHRGKTNYLIGAKVTIRGITKKVKFPVTIVWNGKELTATGNLKLDRTRFNVKYKSGKFFKSLGDKLIYDEFDIPFKIVAKSK